MTSDGFFFTFYYKDTTLALTEMLRQRWETAFATSWPINYFNQFKELKLGTKNKRLVEERDFFSFRLCTKKLHMSDNRLFLKRRKRTWVAIQLREFCDWEECDACDVVIVEPRHTWRTVTLPDLLELRREPEPLPGSVVAAGHGVEHRHEIWWRHARPIPVIWTKNNSIRSSSEKTFL